MDKYSLPLVGEWLYRRDVAAEGGQKTSILARRRAWENHRVKAGMHTYGGCFEPTFNVGGAFVSVGRYCSIAQRVSYFGASHPVERAVMSPYFYNRAFAGLNVDDVPRASLEIGNDVWIGNGALIMPGCLRIGNGSVIGGGSIVTHDVEPYSIVAGNPARVLRMRFDEDTCAALEESRWWELEPGELMGFYDLMPDPVAFAQAVMDGGRND